MVQRPQRSQEEVTFCLLIFYVVPSDIYHYQLILKMRGKAVKDLRWDLIVKVVSFHVFLSRMSSNAWYRLIAMQRAT